MCSSDLHTRTLRAVPAGTTPGDLTPFTGPVMATGERDTITIGSGPNAGTTVDYYVLGQQLSAADDHDSMSSCGYCNGYLLDSTFDVTTVTFFANAYFAKDPAAGGYTAGTPNRSQIQVDGGNAYPPFAARQINANASPGFPALTYSVTQSPANGDTTITESSPIVKCPDATYPPTGVSCPSYVSTGVRADRTITQSNDGHLVTVTDTWVSTDGQQHTIDLLPENWQFFGGSGPTVEYQFPGEAMFSTHAPPETVNFMDPVVPNTISVRVMSSPDGTMTTGRGAIVFDRASSPATFNHLNTTSGFYLQQMATVTPEACPIFRFAYAQDYLAANVTNLAQTAATQFAGLPSTGCAPSSPPASIPTTQSPQSQPTTAKKKCKKGRKLKKGKCVKKKREKK